MERKPRSSKPRSKKDEVLLRALGRRVAGLRLEREMTPEDLASKSKLDRSYVRKLENGQVNPSFLVLAALAGALKIDTTELIKK